MKTRILIFGEHNETRNLYTFFLDSKGYEVLNFPRPATCATLQEGRCSCPRNHVCADIIIADMEMEGMTALELFRLQQERGCRALPRNKVVISTGLNGKEQQEIRELGCKSLHKPFRLSDLLAWIHECERHIRSDRQLAPYESLLEAAALRTS